MAMAIPALPAIAPLLGIGAGGAAATAGAVGTLSTVATAVTTAAGIMQGLGQMSALKADAELDDENAKRVAFRSQVEAQDADFEAVSLLEQQIAQQASSGLSLNSGSYQLQRRNNNVTARLNRERIRQDGTIEMGNLRNQADMKRKQSKSIGTKLFLDTVGAGLTMTGGLINNATRVKTAKARALTTGGLY